MIVDFFSGFAVAVNEDGFFHFGDGIVEKELHPRTRSHLFQDVDLYVRVLILDLETNAADRRELGPLSILTLLITCNRHILSVVLVCVAYQSQIHLLQSSFTIKYQFA